MPYLLLLIGAILAGVGFYRFILKADKRQLKALFLSVVAVAIGLGALIFALTGKLPAAIAILAALWPLGVSYMRNRKSTYTSAPLPSSREEAYDILGLEDGASEDDIRAAHMRLMKKVHPDQQGSDWLAQKINAARDILLNK